MGSLILQIQGHHIWRKMSFLQKKCHFWTKSTFTSKFLLKINLSFSEWLIKKFKSENFSDWNIPFLVENQHFRSFLEFSPKIFHRKSYFWVILIFWNSKSWSKKCSWRENFVIFLIKKKNFPLVMLNLVFISFEPVSRCNRCHRHICHRVFLLDIPLASPTERIWLKSKLSK